MSSARSRLICLLTLTVAAFVAVGASAGAAASRTAYVTTQGFNSITPFDTATNTIGPVIGVGGAPTGVAIAPDGATAYAAYARSDNVTPIDIATNTAGCSDLGRDGSSGDRDHPRMAPRPTSPTPTPTASR
ncbi:MAG: hypothetical protein WBC01_10510, partial [Solirubrobacterales bacterium]